MVKDSLKFLSNSPEMKNLLDDTKIIISRRQPQNLKRLLTKAEFSTSKPKPSVSRCNEPRCGTCDLIITGDSIRLRSGKTWTIKSSMTCRSKDAVYIISPKYKNSYVSQTQRLRNKVTLHKEQITHEQYRHLLVSKQLAECSEGKFEIMPIYQCKGQSSFEKECIEKHSHFIT